MYLSEADIVLGVDNVQKTLARFYKLVNKNPTLGLIPTLLFHSSDLSTPYFDQVQSLSVLEFSIPIIPIDSLDQISQILERFKVSTRLKNPLKTERLSGLQVEKEMLLALINLPNVTEKSARSLLNRFGSVRGVAGAREEELAAVIGTNQARGLYNFLNRKNTI